MSAGSIAIPTMRLRSIDSGGGSASARPGGERLLWIFVPLLALAAASTPRSAPLDGESKRPPRTGTIEGRVTYEGEPPPSTPVAERGAEQPVLYLDSTGGVRYVVIDLPDARAVGRQPSSVATVDQRQFTFEPQVLAVRSSQAVRFTNHDAANHNVRTRHSDPRNTFSVNTAMHAEHVHRFVATSPDHPVELSCDIHAWMVGWVYVFDHDQFAVTDERGRFRIDGVAAGHQRLAVRQPAAGLLRDLAVDVTPSQTAYVDVRFSRRDLVQE